MKGKLTIAAVSILISTAAMAQKGNIGYVYPSGARRGTVVEVTVGGQGLSKAKGIIISGKGVTGELIPAPAGTRQRKKRKKDIGEEDNMQLADEVRFRLSVDKDAALGMRDVRLVMPNGVTNRLYFEIGELPDVLENPKAGISAVSETLPVTFNGQVMRADVDRFRFKARRGQNIVIRVKARTLVPYMADAVPGWFQPVIRLYGPDGKEVAFNDDYTFHVDPVLIHTVQRTGEYDVEINDALWRGRGDFVYRMDVGELPFITGISPLGGAVGVRSAVKLRGVNLKSSSVKIRPSEEGPFPITVQSRAGLSSNTVYYDASSLEQADFSKFPPCTDSKSAWDMGLGEQVENVFSAPMQQHWYRLNIVTGRKLSCHFKVTSRSLGAPTDARMTLFDSSGDIVRDVDDFEDADDCMTTHFADPQMTLALESGTYYMRIIESQGCSGIDYAYRFSVERASPDFSLHIEPATFTVPEYGTGVFNVIIDRKQNFRGPVAISVAGLPSGFKVAGTSLEKGQRKTIISVSAPEGAAHRTVNPRVTGTAERGGTSITRTAVPVETMMQAFYYTHLMPVDEFRMEVAEEQPFRLVVDKTWSGALRLKHGGEVPVRVHIVRRPGFNSPVTVMLKTSGNGVKARAVVIPEGGDEALLQVSLGNKKKNKTDQRLVLSFYGVVKGSSGKVAGKGRNAYVASITAYAPVIDAVIPPVSGK